MDVTSTEQKPLRPSLSGAQIAIASVLYGLLTPHGMAIDGMPDDSAIYTYIGWSMKHGLTPYTDLWDHKGPLLYEIQRIGAILPQPGLGMMLLDGMASACSIALLLWIVCRLLGPRASIVLTVAAALFATVTSFGGNMTETWAVPFLALAHVCAFQAARKHLHPALAPLTAAACTAIFWLRPNMCVFAGLAFAYILWEFLRRRGVGAAAVQFVSGILAAVGVTAISLARVTLHGALPAMKAAYFDYNFAYSRFVSTAQRFRAMTAFGSRMYSDAFSMLAILSWIILAVTLLRQSKTRSATPRSYRILLLVTALVEAASVLLSGRAYLHYLYTLLPVMFLLCALAVQQCGTLLPPDDSPTGHAVVPYRNLIWLLLLVMLPERRIVYKEAMKGQLVNASEQNMAHLVDRVTTPDDRIALLGGPEVGYIYLHAQRFATSRYFYTLPIAHSVLPQVEAIRAQYVHDVIASRPKLLASDPASLSGTLCSHPVECDALNSGTIAENYDRSVLPRMLQPFIAANDVRISSPDLGEWRVYLRRDVAAACCTEQITY